MQNSDTKKSALSDEELMSLYQAGDFAAFEILYTRHSGRVFEYLKKRVVAETAQELMQEAFEKLHKSRSKYNSQYPFLPWLFAISRNTLMDFFKLAETRVASLASETTDVLENFQIPKLDPSLPDISVALANLPAGQRHAIELRYMRDWSFEQIATDMNTSQENARQLISRGVKKIRSIVGKGGNYGS